MQDIASDLRTQKERIYGVLTLTFGALLWVAIVWGVWAGLTSRNPVTVSATRLYLSYGIVIAFFVIISSAFYRATAFGNMILLGPQQFPELYAMVRAGAEALGMKEPPTTFLYNSNGLFNAFARRLFRGRYVFLTSALVEANSDEQVRFVIGHELGHHAAGHLNAWKNLIRLPARAIPFLYPAYSRAREYTCDRIGARLSRDSAASRSSLQMLGCGCRRLNQAMNCNAFLQQEAMVPPIFGFISEIFRSHPRLTRRVSAISDQQFRAGTSAAATHHRPGLNLLPGTAA
jgi:Zn-dependent protease with chaperone function